MRAVGEVELAPMGGTLTAPDTKRLLAKCFARAMESSPYSARRATAWNGCLGLSLPVHWQAGQSGNGR
jgi:hypothetical protein